MKRVKVLWRTVCVTVFSLCLFTQQCYAGTAVQNLIPDIGFHSDLSESNAVSKAVFRWKTAAIVFVSLAFMTCVFFLALNITKLGTTGANERERKRAISRILYSGIALAILGSLDLFLGFFFGFLG